MIVTIGERRLKALLREVLLEVLGPAQKVVATIPSDPEVAGIVHKMGEELRDFAATHPPKLGLVDERKPVVVEVPGTLTVVSGVVEMEPPAASGLGRLVNKRRRYSDADRAEIARVLLEVGSMAGAERRLGLPNGTIRFMMRRGLLPGIAAPTKPVAEPEAVPPPPVVDEPPAAEPAPDPEPEPARTVAREPVLAPMRPVPPVPVMRPIAPMQRREREIEQATPKGVRQWLEASLRNGGLGKLAAEDKVAAMTHDQALQQANIRRIALKLPPFAFIGAKA